MMTRDEQVDAAMALLAPPADRRDECRREIELMLDYVERHSKDAAAFKVFGSKKARGDLRRYAMHLRAARDIISELDPAIRPWFLFFLGELDQEIKTADQWASEESSKRDAIRVKAALEPTELMLRRWGHKATRTRGGRWERLIKIAANTHHDVYNHMRAFRRNPRFARARLVNKDGLAVGVGRVPRDRKVY